MELRCTGRDRGVDQWELPDGSRFAGTREDAEIAAGLREAQKPVTEEAEAEPAEDAAEPAPKKGKSRG
jgi:hypothetical protein